MIPRSKSLADPFYNWQIVPEDINKSSSFTYRSELSYLQKTIEIQDLEFHLEL